MPSMKQAVQWCINIANNNNYTYGLGAGHGDTVTFGNYKGKKFDCSSFVAFGLYHGGFYNANQHSFATYDEENALRQLGFHIYNYNDIGYSNLKSGMILWYTASESDSSYGHTGIMVSPTQLAEAYTDEVSRNEQIRITNNVDGRGWRHIAYLDGDIDFDNGIWDEKSICALLGNMWYESTMNPQIEENLGQGGVVGLGVGLIQWSNAGSYANNWNSILQKANAYGFNTTNPKQISAQCKAIEYELLDGTIQSSGGYSPTAYMKVTGEQFIKNSKNLTIEQLTKKYSYARGEFAPRHNNWQGVDKAKELYKTLPNFNKSISEIGYNNLIQTDEVLGDFYGTNTYLPNDDVKMYNCKLIFDYLKSGSDRPIYTPKKLNDMIFCYPNRLF